VVVVVVVVVAAAAAAAAAVVVVVVILLVTSIGVISFHLKYQPPPLPPVPLLLPPRSNLNAIISRNPNSQLFTCWNCTTDHNGFIINQNENIPWFATTMMGAVGGITV